MPVESIKHIDPIFRVLESYAGSGTAFQVALIYARHARADGSRTNPPIQRIANRTQKCVRTVQYHTRALEKSGWLTLTNPGDGRFGQANCYRISRDWLRNAAHYVRQTRGHRTSKQGAKNSINADEMVLPLVCDIAPTEGAKAGGFAAKKSVENTEILHPQYKGKHIYKKKKNEEVNKTYVRARAITADWFLPKKAGDWALQTFSGWTEETVRACAEKFKAYWVPMGTELTDWTEVWREHCQREANFLARRARSQAVGSPWSSDATQGASRGLPAHPGETMEAYRRRLQAIADTSPSTVSDKPALAQPARAAMASPKESGGDGPLSPESIARRKVEIAKAKAAAQKGECMEAERRGADLQSRVPCGKPIAPVNAPGRPSTGAMPISLHVAKMRAALEKKLSQPPASEPDATVSGGVSRHADDSVSEATVPVPCVPVATDYGEAPAQRSVALHAGRIRKPDGKRRGQRYRSFERYRGAICHARASPDRQSACKAHHFDFEKLRPAPWRMSSGTATVRLRYLLPDATGQWR